MDTSHFIDTPASLPTDSNSENIFDNRNTNFDFENPRFPETKSSLSRSQPYTPYNSRPCLLFLNRKCHYGENCRFTHSTSEVRNPGPGGFKPAAMKEHLNEDSESTDGVCRIRGHCFYYSSGVDCPYGEKCQFPHNCDQRVKRDREICAIEVSNQIPWPSLCAVGKHHDKSVFRKTKLCNKWEWFGDCPYGVRCHYAHGRAELGFPPRPVIVESSIMARKVAEKLALKGRSYFTNWDIATVSRIYADDCVMNV